MYSIKHSPEHGSVYDAVVIGGGLIGCFALRNLARYRLSAALIEKREDLCTGISRSNTAIIYAGSDTKPGTLKAAMCVRAAQSFSALCKELSVRYITPGSVMVSFGTNGEAVLRKKLHNGLLNGVRGIRMLSASETLEMEPCLSPEITAGLYMPDTGTVLPWELCLAAAENAFQNGAGIFLNSEADNIMPVPGGFKIQIGGKAIFSKCLINCAGLFADKLMEKISAPSVRIIPSVSDYMMLDTDAKGLVKHIIFHETEDKSKGLNLVPTADGNILIGSTERDGDDFATAPEGLNTLRRLVRQVVPGLPMDLLIRSFGAVRPNPYYYYPDQNGVYQKSDKSINDFCVIESAGGAAISLVGIKTPGLTCANELGQHAARKIADFLNAKEKTDFNPRREKAPLLREMSSPERELFTAQNAPAYSRIVCRCKDVSEGEIVDAIRRFPPASTLDGIKRRLGCGNGRCQGGFCAMQITEILARELNIPITGIMKDGPKSHIYLD